MTDLQWINLLLQGGPVVPLVVLLWMLYRGNLVTRESRDREIATLERERAAQMALMERALADVTRDRDHQDQLIDALLGYIPRTLDITDKQADMLQRRALMPRPPAPSRRESGGHDD